MTPDDTFYYKKNCIRCGNMPESHWITTDKGESICENCIKENEWQPMRAEIDKNGKIHTWERQPKITDDMP